MRFDNGWVHGLEGLEDFGTGEFGMLFLLREMPTGREERGISPTNIKNHEHCNER